MKNLLLLFILCATGSSVFAQINLKSGLVAYYPFNGTFNDASGNGNHGTGQNGVTFTADQWGNPNNAAYFDGVDDWINVGVPSFTFRRRFTIAFRYKTNTPRCQNILTKANYTGSPQSLQFQVAFNHPNQTSKGLFLGTNHTGTCLFGPSRDLGHFGISQNEVSANTWGCAVIVFDSGLKKIYRNGVLELTTTTTGAFPTVVDSCPSPFRIGNWWQGDPLYYSGILDEIRLYNRALNTLEIDSLCNLITRPEDTIINKYAAILDRNSCDNSFVVDSTTGFSVGDTVLMIQMKGAGVDTGNTIAFGAIKDYGASGNYELNIIKAISGNRITLQNRLQRQYTIPWGRVQFVRVPSFASYNVSRRHSCLPWSGSKGGVFIINVAGTLSLNSDIDVSGKGFRGGLINQGNTLSCDKSDYYYPSAGNDGGEKGEGIAEVPASMMRGKGKLANGGGGGNNHNAGGGGGSNAGQGGAGGNQFASCNQTLSSGGIGGVALSLSSTFNRLFFGGGGGCGHENNGNTDPGGNGGGIAIIMAGTVAGSGHFIKSNGESVDNTNSYASVGVAGDGQSGGGAGGTILLKVGSFVGSPLAETKGGAGGSIYATALHGPGGGGGGGCLVYSGATLPTSNISTVGGASGKAVNLSNATHGAQPGQVGTAISGVLFSMPSTVFQPNQMTIGFTDSMLTCVSLKFTWIVTTTTIGVASYEWSSGSLISTQKNPILTFPGAGTYLVKLVVTDSNGCRDSLIRPVVLNYPRFANASSDTAICLGQSVELTASGGKYYSWSPAATLSDSTVAVVIAHPAVVTTYEVIVTDSNGCVDRDSITITITPSPAPITAIPSDTVLCNGSQLQLSAINGQTYQWAPPQGLSSTSIANPVAIVKADIQYVVSGTDVAGCLSEDTVNIRLASDPVVKASSDGTAISCDHAGVQVFASGAATFTWSPAEFVSDIESASPLATPQHTTVFTVTGIDSNGCKGSDTITVFSFANAGVFMPDAFTPNQDGRNDRIRPIAYCDFELAEFRIFDRWGECVFYGFDGAQGWDGTFRGKPAPIGVYGYFVRGVTPSTGKEVIVKGSFSLLR